MRAGSGAAGVLLVVVVVVVVGVVLDGGAATGAVEHPACRAAVRMIPRFGWGGDGNGTRGDDRCWWAVPFE